MRDISLLLQIADFSLNHSKQMTVMNQPLILFIDFNGGGFLIESNHLTKKLIIIFVFTANFGADF